MADEAQGNRQDVVQEASTSGKISKKFLKRLQIAAASKLRCELCGTKRFTSLQMYDDHMASKKHRRRQLRKDSAGLWSCQACDLMLSSEKEWEKHLCGRRHHDKLKEWGLHIFPTGCPVTQKEIDLLDDSQLEEIEYDSEEGSEGKDS